MSPDACTGDSHLRTYHGGPVGDEEYAEGTVWGETAHGHSPGKRHFPDADGVGDAFPQDEVNACYGIQHQKRHIPEPPYDRPPAHPAVGSSPPQAAKWNHDFGAVPKHSETRTSPAAAATTYGDWGGTNALAADPADPLHREVAALARGEAFTYKPMF